MTAPLTKKPRVTELLNIRYPIAQDRVHWTGQGVFNGFSLPVPEILAAETVHQTL
jgi:hypothetical protein